MLQQVERSTGKIIVRQVTVDDTKLLANIAASINASFRTKFNLSYDRITESELMDFIKQESSALICAFEHQQGSRDVTVAGTIGIERENDTECYLNLFYVHPEYQAKAVGVRLLYTICLIAKDLGYAGVVGKLDENDKVLSNWYKRLGAYKINGPLTREHPLPANAHIDGGMKVILMRRDLDQMPERLATSFQKASL